MCMASIVPVSCGACGSRVGVYVPKTAQVRGGMLPGVNSEEAAEADRVEQRDGELDDARDVLADQGLLFAIADEQFVFACPRCNSENRVALMSPHAY